MNLDNLDGQMPQEHGPKLEDLSMSRPHCNLGGRKNVPETAEEANVMSHRGIIHHGAISMVQRSAIKASYHDGCLEIDE